MQLKAQGELPQTPLGEVLRQCLQALGMRYRPQILLPSGSRK